MSLPELAAASEGVEFDDEAEPGDDAAERLDEHGGGRRGTAGGQHVVDDQDPFARVDRVTVDLELVGAVFELVLLAHDRPRELAGLAHGNEARTHAVGDGSGEDETPGFDADHPVDLNAVELLDQAVDRRGEGGAVAQQRRDVAERDAVDRVVADVSDEALATCPYSPAMSRGYRRARAGFVSGASSCAAAAGATAVARGAVGRVRSGRRAAAGRPTRSIRTAWPC